MSGAHNIHLKIVFLVPLLFICIASAEVTSVAKANQISAISDALQKNEPEKALQLLRPALQAFPLDPVLWTMQGKAYGEEQLTKQALVSFQHALKIAPDYLPALHGAAQIEYDAGSSAAIPLIERVTRLQPDDQISHGMLAVLNYQRGNYAEAISHFQKTGSLFDSQSSALDAYTVCLVKLKQFDRAATIFEKIVALDPTDAKERQLLAAVQVMAHQSAEALATLEPLMQSSGSSVETLELASTAYEEAKDTSQAVDTLRKAILLEPQNVNLYLDFANISYTHGSFQVGIDVINDGLGLLPKAAPLYFARGVFYVQLAQYDKAEADFEEAYALDPNQTLSVAAQGLAAAQENDFDRALTKVQASLARKPNDPLLLYLQADILAEKHVDAGSVEFRLAIRSAKRAVALQPSLGVAEGVLGKLYLQSGRYAEAALACRKALVNDPKDQSAVYHLIQALRRSGDTHEIPELLKQLALLRRQAEKEERERYRYKLVDPDSPQ